MDDQELKKRIRDEILAEQFPELVEIDPDIKYAPSESQLRTLRRSRDVVTADDVKALPMEYTLTYQRPSTDEQPFDRTVVVVTDDEGKTQFIIESK